MVNKLERRSIKKIRQPENERSEFSGCFFMDWAKRMRAVSGCFV
ncbi:hypothetical protein [Kingella sp. (in: b-proteobacteria)]|nr:hypothetical protein [Kingella sp. (in: b-proteobacteria)]MDO4657573.1 hypothetical protein [Kingella sp. (in: b-proteobacteria)]